jgi:hypothetical protein
MDSGEPIYSVFQFSKDDGSMFGKGIPRMARDAQDAHNAAWRMLMDNAGLSSGPQIEIDTAVLEPADGDWTLAPRKVWKRKPDAGNKQGLFIHNIDGHQTELLNIVQTSKQFLEDETAMPAIAGGEAGAMPQQTAHGMSIVMNSANIVFRRLVKNFDDQITTPNIRRMYDWNMQFSQNDDIKGDFNVDARGTSVLLVREVQQQNLMNIAQNWSAHPVLKRFLVDQGLPAARKAVQAGMIVADEIIITDDQFKQLVAAEQEAAKHAPQDPVTARLQMQMQLADKEHTYRMAELQQAHENEMIKYAATMNIGLDKLRAMMQDRREQRASNERMFAAETAVTARRDAMATARNLPLPHSEDPPPAPPH